MPLDQTRRLTPCYDLISLLESQLRAALELRESLENGENSRSAAMGPLADRLLDGAVRAAQRAADLRQEIRGNPVRSLNSAGRVRGRKQDSRLG
jgi:hypothetical protein